MATVMNTQALVISLAVCCLLPGTRAACYYPSGDMAPHDTPCRDDTTHATCCGQGYACLSNGICQATGEEFEMPGAALEFVRGSCTDKTWRSSSCPLFCIDEEHDNVFGGNSMVKCENTSQDLYYCLNDEESSCEDHYNVLYFPGTPSAITTIGVLASTSTFSSTSSATTTSSTSQGSPTTTGSDKPAETQDSPDDDNTSSPNVGAIVGGVIGGVAAVVLAGVGGWLLAKKQAGRANTVEGMNVNRSEIPPLPSGPYQLPQQHQKLSYVGTQSYYDVPQEPHTFSPYSSPTPQHPYNPYGTDQPPPVSELLSDRPHEMPTDNQ